MHYTHEDIEKKLKTKDMKKILLSLMLLLATTMTVNAQQIFTEVKKMAQESVDNPATNPMVKKISLFKLDALNYMAMKMREEMPDSTAELLDKEALSLHIFINNYTNALVANSQQPAAFQMKIIKGFMDASYSNPLFNDDDKEVVHAYFNDGTSMTRFSLDTDWRRAVLAAEEAMKRLKN